MYRIVPPRSMKLAVANHNAGYILAYMLKCTGESPLKIPCHALCLRLGLFLLPCAVFGASPSGEAVYQKRCSGCHEQTSPRIPHREALQKMPSTRILRALDSGAMMSIAFTMSREDRIAVASYLGTDAAVPGPLASAFCPDRSVKLAAAPKVAWNGWSPGSSNAPGRGSRALHLPICRLTAEALGVSFVTVEF